MSDEEKKESSEPSGSEEHAPEVAHAVAHGDVHGDVHGEGAHFGHVTSVKLLFAVWGSLMLFTWITVAATYVDLGSSGNLIIAMVIATVKASLVVLYFMHLRWDKPFNALVFISGLLFVSLFISIALLDKSEYERDIQDMYELKDAQK